MFILNWLEGLNNNNIVNFFVFLLLFIGILNVISIVYSLKKNKLQRQTAKADMFLENVGGIYLSVGVFGTFMGITVGLLDFNVANIDASIPPLLEGLKISFVTSLVGVFCNIISQKAGILFLPKKNSDETSALNEIIFELRAARAYEKEKEIKTDNFYEKQFLSNKKQENNLEKLFNSLAQIQEMSTIHHSENIEYQQVILEANEIHNKKMIQKLNEFGEQLSKQATDHIVEALNQVVKDFNENMVDQFGENFKRLNQGIDNLLVWQDNYKSLVLDEIGLIQNVDQKIIEILHNMEKFENGIDSFLIMSENLNKTAHLVNETNDITIRNSMKAAEVMEEQKDTNNTIASQLIQMKDAILSSSSNIKEDLEMIRQSSVSQHESAKNQLELLVSIKDEYKDVKENQEKLAKESSQKIIELQTNSNNLIEKHSKDMILLSENASTSQKEAIKEALSNYKDELRQVTEKHSESIQKMSGDATTEQREMIRKTMESYKKETTDALEDIVNVLGNDLASLSEKFVDDYSPLTDKLQKVVHIANGIDITE